MANNGYNRNQPKYEWGDGWTKNCITEKQANYIAILIDKAGQRGINIQMQKPLNQITRGQASGLIDELKRVSGGDSPKYLIRDWASLVAVEK